MGVVVVGLIGPRRTKRANIGFTQTIVFKRRWLLNRGCPWIELGGRSVGIKGVERMDES